MEMLRETNPTNCDIISEETQVISELFGCICCHIQFESEEKLDNHNRTKKHKQNFKKLMKELENEEFMKSIPAARLILQDQHKLKSRTVYTKRPGRVKKKNTKKKKKYVSTANNYRQAKAMPVGFPAKGALPETPL